MMVSMSWMRLCPSRDRSSCSSFCTNLSHCLHTFVKRCSIGWSVGKWLICIRHLERIRARRTWIDLLLLLLTLLLVLLRILLRCSLSLIITLFLFTLLFLSFLFFALFLLSFLFFFSLFLFLLSSLFLFFFLFLFPGPTTNLGFLLWLRLCWLVSIFLGRFLAFYIFFLSTFFFFLMLTFHVF